MFSSHIDFEEIRTLAEPIVRRAGDYIRSQFVVFDRSRTEQKGLHDYVSYVDKQSEKILIDGLEKLIPEAGFIAEENTIAYNNQHLVWIIDPLDGTTNFIHGVPCFAVSVALVLNNQPKVGFIYEINHNEMFSAVEGSGAFLNGNQIIVSETYNFPESFLVTGFPYNDYGRLDDYLRLMKHLLLNTRGITRLGSAATDLAYVACGRFDAFYEYGLSPWDVAAGILLVREAGGTLSDFKAGNNFLFGKELIASNGKIHDALLKATQQFMASSH